MSPLKGLVRVFNGNYQLLTNAIVEIAIRVPIRYAPAVTTYLGFLLALVCAWMMGRLLLSRGCSVLQASAGCAMFALQPAGYEVFLNATNVQWVTSVIGLLLCLWDDLPATSPRAGLCYFALAVCGLTGTTTCILLPLFVVGAIWRKSGFGWAMVAVLGVATVLQGGIVLAHRAEMHRAFAISDHALLPLVFQVIFAQILPGDAVNGFAPLLAPHTPSNVAQAAQWAALGLGGLGLVVWRAACPLGAVTAGLLGATVLGISLVNEFGSQATADQMLSAAAGSRYFFIGATGLLVLVAALGRAPGGTGRATGWVVIALVLANGVVTARLAAWPVGNVTGPSFSDQVDACQGAPSCGIRVWPGFFTLPLTVRMPPAG